MNRAYQTLIYFSTIVVGQGISFLLLPIITRYLPPAEYGEYMLALALSSLASTFGSSWIRSVSFRLYFDAKQIEQTRAFFWTTALFQAGLLGAAYGALLLFLPAFSSSLVPVRVLLAAGLTLLFGDFYLHAKNFLRAEEQSGQFAVSEISSGVLRLVGTTAGLLVGFRSPEFLFYAAALAVALPGLYAAHRVNARLRGAVRLDMAVLRGVFRYGPASLPVSISTWFERRVDLFVLQYFIGKEVVGLYTAAYALADRVLGGVVLAVFMMSWPKVLNAWNESGSAGARRALSQALRLYFWLSVGPAVFIALFNGLMIALLGPEYRGAASIIPIVVAATWLAGLNIYLNRHLELKKRYFVISGIASAGAGANLGLNLLLVPLLAAQGAALATLGGHLLAGAMFFLIRDPQYTRIPYRDLVGALALAGLAWLSSTAFPVAPFYAAGIFVVVYTLGLGILFFGAKPYRRLLLSRYGSEGD